MQNKLPFFVIIGLAVLIVAGMGLVYLVWPKAAAPLPAQQQPLLLQLLDRLAHTGA